MYMYIHAYVHVHVQYMYRYNVYGQINNAFCLGPLYMYGTCTYTCVVRTFPTHRLFAGETPAKVYLYRVLMMYSIFNPTVGYCQGE